uniref:Uncharacterized protein n=1 Tax=Acrobeloides nanus TaxID=290746 RepID=A0A914ECI6_9BILA
MDLSAYDLYMLIHQRNVQFPEALIAYITIAAVEALDFLQQKEPLNVYLDGQTISVLEVVVAAMEVMEEMEAVVMEEVVEGRDGEITTVFCI